MDNTTWATVLIVMIVIAKGFHDQNRIEDDKKIYHKVEWGIVVVLSYIPIVWFVEAVELEWYYVLPIAAGMCAFFIWLTFDAFLNKLRGYGIWFTGSEDGKDDAATDDFLQGLTLRQHIQVKVIPLVFFTTIYVLMYILCD